jgi:hypothetical protein
VVLAQLSLSRPKIRVVINTWESNEVLLMGRRQKQPVSPSAFDGLEHGTSQEGLKCTMRMARPPSGPPSTRIGQCTEDIQGAGVFSSHLRRPTPFENTLMALDFARFRLEAPHLCGPWHAWRSGHSHSHGSTRITSWGIVFSGAQVRRWGGLMHMVGVHAISSGLLGTCHQRKFHIL